MATSLLQTKLYVPPPRPELVPRPRLIERLEEGLRLGCRLTLVSAPAGFGKSTLVTGWLAESGRSAAWLSLDEGDNDPVRFWTYLIAAVQAVHPEVGDEARQIVGSPQLRSAELVVVSLLNEIAELTRDLILVLDDYHLIQAQQIHDGLNYLLDHQPPNLHLVLISRVDPPLSLARSRAHRQLIEIRAVDLQFSAAEAAMLFSDVMNLQLKPEQVTALHLRTEGWVVGLQLAALSLRRHPAYDTFIEHFAGSHQFILDYLTEEVLRALPDAQRQFLLRTSILDRFCGALCHAVTGDAASQRLLDKIRKGNLFLIPLGDINSTEPGGRWFRYHHLFAEVLRALLERDHPDEMAALHLEAAAWFEDQGYASEAVDHALHSGDMQRAKELILKHRGSILHRGEMATMLRWLDALPEEMEGDDPSLSLARCWALFLSGQSAAMAPHLERANDAYERLVSTGILDGAPQRLVAAQLAMMRSVLARSFGQHAESVSFAEQAVRLLSPEMLEGAGTAWNMLGAARAGAGDYDGAIEAHRRGNELVFAEGNLTGAYMSTYARVMYLIVQGRLNEAGESCRTAIERGLREGHGGLPVAGWSHVAMARIELERYRLDQAQAYLDDGLHIARPGGQGELLRAGRYLRAHLAAARGNQDGAAAILQDIERIVDALDDPYMSGELAWQWTAVYLNTGDLNGARAKLAVLEEMYTATRHANLLLARGWLAPRLLSAEGRYDEALAELAEAIRWARASNSAGQLVHLLVLQAVALHATGKREPARSALREGLALGAPGGYIRRWLDAGPSIAPLLRDVRDGGDTPQALYPYLDSLLDACRSAFGDVALQPAHHLAHQLVGEMLDSLTARELEVTRLICQGYSNAEIARQLVVAVSTIKKHASHIYDKLGVRSRSQAIARAHDLGLV
jgi:LuxR family maltose regulon positive regulatory protein